MQQGALPPPRICIVLHLLLLADLVSPVHVLDYSVGASVTINCLEGCNKSVTRDNITQITWKKYNTSHSLLFSTTGDLRFSNFSESRFSFEDLLTLRISDAQPSDSGNYSCQLSSASEGNCDNTFSLRVPGNSPGNSSGGASSQTESLVVYASSAAAAAVIIIIVVIVIIVYWRRRPKTDKPPDKIHQTCPETQQREEPVYDNADQDYCLRFNALYDGVTLYRTLHGNVLTEDKQQPNCLQRPAQPMGMEN